MSELWTDEHHKTNCSIQICYTRWLPGFARVPYAYYAPSTCHMHPFHNCHHIKSCHRPVKQYITTHHNTEFIYQFTIFYLLYQVLLRSIPASLARFPHSSLAPLFARLLPPFPLPPSSARLVPPFFPSLRPCLVSSLPRSFRSRRDTYVGF